MTNASKQLVLFILLVVLAFPLTGCWSGLVHSDPAQPIVADAGQVFALSLPTDPSGKFTWVMSGEPDKDVARLTTEKEVRRQYFNVPRESQNEEFWIFQAVATGDTTITMQFTNQETQEVKETRTFNVHVK
jgi:predicted secreted protein